jgi:hypothetical protein
MSSCKYQVNVYARLYCKSTADAQKLCNGLIGSKEVNCVENVIYVWILV